MAERIKVLVGDSHPLGRAGLVAMLERDLGLSGIAEAGDYPGMVAAITRDPSIRLIALNIELPDMNRLDGLRRLCIHNPGLLVVVMAYSRDRNTVLDTLAAGAQGYVPLDLPTEEMAAAFRAVLRGQMYVPAQVSTMASGISSGVTEEPGEAHLTLRQREVLSLLVAGGSNKEIARRLHIAEGTVKVHVTAAFRLLGVKNRVSAAAAFQALQAKAGYQQPSLPGLHDQRRRAGDAPVQLLSTPSRMTSAA